MKVESGYLSELRAEMTENIRVGNNKYELREQILASSKRALSFLDADGPCESQCWELLVDFFIASQVPAEARSRVIFDEMLRLGLPRSPTLKDAMIVYDKNERADSLVTSEFPQYRQTVRGLFPPDAAQALWQNCHSTVGGERNDLEVFLTNCEQNLSDDKIENILTSLRSNPMLRQELQYWTGQIVFNLKAYDSFRVRGQNVIKEIDAELEGKP